MLTKIQLSIFDFLNEPDVFTQEVKRGSGFAEGKKRIKEAVAECKGNIHSLASFLRKEYGIGGWCGPNMPKVDYNSKGFWVGMTFEDKDFYTWEQVAQKILELIARNDY